MKRCSNCKIEKTIDEYYKRKDSKDGHAGQCKLCISLKTSSHYKKHKNEVLNRQKVYYERNKASQIEYANNYRKDNKELIKLAGKKYREKNIDIIKTKKREYFQKNKKKIYSYINERKRNDPLFKLTCNLRSRLKTALKNNYKSGSAVRDLGCTIDELKNI